MSGCPDVFGENAAIRFGNGKEIVVHDSGRARNMASIAA
jgi:hypothetical protein